MSLDCCLVRRAWCAVRGEQCVVRGGWRVVSDRFHSAVSSALSSRNLEKSAKPWQLSTRHSVSVAHNAARPAERDGIEPRGVAPRGLAPDWLLSPFSASSLAFASSLRPNRPRNLEPPGERATCSRLTYVDDFQQWQVL